MTPDENEALTPALGTGDVMLYERDDGTPALRVLLTDETVRLSQQPLAGLFHTSRTNITEHIKHIYDEGELLEAATCRDFRQVRPRAPAR